MNKTLTSFCLDAFDTSISSPIGCAIKFYYQSLPFKVTDDINIFLLQKKLIDMNNYDSPKSFISDLQCVVNRACRFFGTESDISIALLSFQYSIQTFLRPVIELTQNDLTNSVNNAKREENNQPYSEKNSKWLKSKNKLFENLNSFLDEMPNDIESFKISTAPIQIKPYVDNEEHFKYPNSDFKIDYLDLKSRIERIEQDRNVSELMEIIEHYEPELVSSYGTIRIDLKSCDPHTLYLIDEFVKKCKLRPLPKPIVASNEEKIQRSQSVPLRKSSSSSTIILQNPLHNKSIQQQQELQQQVQNQQQQIQNQMQVQQQSQIQNQIQNLPQFLNQNQNQSNLLSQLQSQFQNSSPNYFTKNGINRKTALQNLNQQHQLRLQLKNVNSYNIKNSRNNVSFSHTSSLNTPTSSSKPTNLISTSSNSTPLSLDAQDSNSSSPASSLMNISSGQSSLIPQKSNSSSQMMSNITVQPSSMTALTPSPPPKQKRAYKTKQPKQPKNSRNQKNPIVDENIQHQLQKQMQLQQQQGQQVIGPESQQFSPYIQEAISIARMKNLIKLPETGINPNSSSSLILSNTSISAPSTPAIHNESVFNHPSSNSLVLESETATISYSSSNTTSQPAIASPSPTSNSTIQSSVSPEAQSDSTISASISQTLQVTAATSDLPDAIQSQLSTEAFDNSDKNSAAISYSNYFSTPKEIEKQQQQTQNQHLFEMNDQNQMLQKEQEKQNQDKT